MGAGRRRRRGFLCFGVAPDAVADEAEAAVKAMSVTAASGSEPELRRRRSLRRVMKNFLRSLSNQSSSRLLEQKPIGLSLPPPPLSAANLVADCDDRRSESVLTTSASSSLSLSSNSSTASSLSSTSLLSRASSGSFPAAETVFRQKRAPKPAPATDLVPAPSRRKCDPARGMCLLLVSLMVMMFCGRLCAILWTSTWLCLVPVRNVVVAVAPETPSEGGGEAIVTAEVRAKGRDDCDKKRVVLEGLLDRNRRI